MATKGKDDVHRKERRGLSPSGTQNVDQPHGRSLKSSIATSPDKDLSMSSAKPTPHYLKPTISSGQEVHKHGNKQVSEDKKLIRRRSFDKPPSPSQVHKTPLSTSSRERILKLSSPSPKTLSSPRVISDKTLIASRNGKTQQSMDNLKAMKKGPNTTIFKKEPKATNNTSSSSSSTPTSPDINITSEEIKLGKKEKESHVVEQVEEEILVENPAAQDSKVVDLQGVEPMNSPEDYKSKPCDSSTLQGEQEAAAADEKRDNDSHHKDEEHCLKEDNNNNNQEIAEHHSKESLSAEPESLDDVETMEGEEGVAEKPAVSKGKVAPRENCGDGVVGEAKLENVVLMKRKEVKGKKECQQAYNDVIEETASKLVVEKKKSKVRALVGAFETVISLQELPEGSSQQS